jgi:hypothetical protein
MELNQSEVSDGKLWLLCAGACALALSFFIYRVDEYMVQAPAREHQHNIMMNELRSAQTGLGTVDVDHRQALPLAMEKESNAGLPYDVIAGHSNDSHDDHQHHGNGHAGSAHGSSTHGGH